MNDRDDRDRMANERERAQQERENVWNQRMPDPTLAEIVRRIAENQERQVEQQQELTATVKMLAERVQGEGGLAVEMVRLRDDFETKHAENTKRQERNFKIIVAVVPAILGMLVWLFQRSLYVTVHGVTLAHP